MKSPQKSFNSFVTNEGKLFRVSLKEFSKKIFDLIELELQSLWIFGVHEFISFDIFLKKLPINFAYLEKFKIDFYKRQKTEQIHFILV